MYMCANVPSRNKQMFIYQGFIIFGCTSRSISKLFLYFFFSSRCFNNSDGDFLIGEGNGLLMFSLSSITGTLIAQFRVLPQIFFSLSIFFVCLSLQFPSGVRSWSPQSLGRWWSSRMRYVPSRWGPCFSFSPRFLNLTSRLQPTCNYHI